MLNPPGVVPTLPKDAQFVAVGKPKAPVEPHPLTADQYIAERKWIRTESPQAIADAKETLEKRFGVDIDGWQIDTNLPADTYKALKPDERTGPHKVPEIRHSTYLYEEVLHNTHEWQFRKDLGSGTLR